MKQANQTVETMDRRVYLIDASVYIFRAWFSLPDSMTDASGRPVNALTGFADMLARLIRSQTPAHIAVAFDESLTSSFRNRIDPAYKANRESAPEELKHQFRMARQVCDAIGLYNLACEEYEADDYIGSLLHVARGQGWPGVIVSPDKDLAQLLDADDVIWDFAKNDWMDAQAITAKFGVTPAQMLDYQALVGDTVDNIPGIAGIGPKAAVALLTHFGSLDAIYADLDQVLDLPVRGAKRLRRLLEEQRDVAERSRQLARIVTTIPLEDAASQLVWQRPTPEASPALLATGLGTGATERLLSACAVSSAA
ncbi:MAG: 5'-3' exonuclease H3TH domain-containing protein [Abyssibacter sp.]|uniref:5'-3' exonuclease n=1 Tax=Abyssibacter sp. TaxID=2320200 RepID=UPI0032196A8F